MVKTHGLTHISLAVKDPERSLSFYSALFGVREYYRDEEQIQVQGPGPHDVIVFTKAKSMAGKLGGISHFGFRLTKPSDIKLAVSEAKKAGAKILRQGEFAPGLPYLYIHDPDGYEIEIWFE